MNLTNTYYRENPCIYIKGTIMPVQGLNLQPFSCLLKISPSLVRLQLLFTLSLRDLSKNVSVTFFMWLWLHALLLYLFYICLCFTTIVIFLHTSALLFASFPTRPQVFQGLLLLISPQSRPWFLRCPSCSSPCSLYAMTRKIWDLLHTPNRSGHVFDFLISKLCLKTFFVHLGESHKNSQEMSRSHLTLKPKGKLFKNDNK